LEYDENLFKTTWRVIRTYIRLHRLHDDEDASPEESPDDGLLEAISQNMQLADNAAIIHEESVDPTTPSMAAWMDRLLAWSHDADHDISVAAGATSHRRTSRCRRSPTSPRTRAAPCFSPTTPTSC
jgi:hypothetical protein